MNRSRKFGIISTVLVAALIFVAVFNVAYIGTLPNIGKAPVSSEVAKANSSIQKSDIDFSSVREQYLNFENVEKTTAGFDGQRWVIVELEGNSLYDEFKQSTRFSDFTEYVKSIEAQKALASIRAKQSRFISKLDRYGVDYVYKYSYSTLSTGVAIKVDASGYNTIAAMSDVEDVYYSEHYAVPEYTAVENSKNAYTTGIYDTKDLADIDTNGDGIKESYQGQGMAVAILDTGLDSTHEAFDPEIYTQDLIEAGALDDVHYDRETVDGFVRALGQDGAPKLNAVKRGAGTDDLYYNLKVPFAYDYADDDAQVFPAYSNHGTHVAGIVAGKSDYDVTPDDKTDNETFIGVAPLAQLVICKVFTDDLYDEYLGGADGIDILAALEDCATIGVDVINMSLGTSAGFSDEKSDAETSRIYNNLREMGISLVCAASNDYSSGFGGGNGTNLATNPDSGTVGSPSTYFSALSVASINGQLSQYIRGNGKDDQVAFITKSSDGDGNRIEFIDELHIQLEAKYGQAAAANGADLRGGTVFTKGAKEDLKLKYVLIGGVGRSSNYNAGVRKQLNDRTYNGEPIDGTIALVRRGDTTFEEKVQEAMNNGADAVIIYNNVSGTINMSLGEVRDPVPTCLITMDAAVGFVDDAKNNGNIGTVEVSYSFEAGPFMSDFSSWGPVSDLTLKPEITAHGGEITSSVPGAYDVLSGTSMASPNMAGAVALLRQYLKAANPDLQANDPATVNRLNALANQLLMSTATIARNEEGNPYSPRKQGAGLAGIKDAVLSEGYITVRPNPAIYTEDNPSTKNCIVDGWLDKTKIELLDDPARTGVYVLEFTVHNITEKVQTYKPTVYVMTESLASDNKTVAEKAYMLTDMCDIKYEGMSADGTLMVPAGASANVKVTITLGDEARKYFEQEVESQRVGKDGRIEVDANGDRIMVKPFQNGMYVEGFVSLDNITNGEDSDKGVTLGVPYLAFYGDWSDAPLFDYDVYEVSESENNSAIEFEDKLKASALATQVIGRYHERDDILPLGTYLYEMADDEDEINPAREKIALSMYDEEGRYTVYELYAAYAGLLRNASTIKAVIKNAKTGETVYTEDLHEVGKSYAAGGGNRGAFVRFEINPSEWGWQNNDEFEITIEGWLDYKDKDGNYVQSSAVDDEPQTDWTGTRNTFEFPLTIDYENPQILDYNIRFDSYKEYGETKYRVYLDLTVYDNQYVMSVLPCFLKEETEGKLGTYLNLLTEYPVPVYGEKGTETTVSIEITDYYEQYGLTGELYVQIDDYALNAETYNITLDADSLTYPDEGVTFISDRKLTKRAQDGYNPQDGSTYPVYDLSLNPFELYKINTADPDIFQNLTWTGESDLVKVDHGEIFALDHDAFFTPTTLNLVGHKSYFVNSDIGWTSYDAVYAQINVTVTNGKKGNMPSASMLSFKPVHAGDEHMVNLDTSSYVEVNPNTVLNLRPVISPWYFEAAYEYQYGKKFEFVWTTSNDSVATVEGKEVKEDPVEDEYGRVTEVEPYFAGEVSFITRGNVTISCGSPLQEYRHLGKQVIFSVGEDYYVNNYTLYEYYGGSRVELPSDVNVMYLDEDCFKNDKTIEEVILPPLLMEIPNFAFQGCVNLKKITIPSQCAVIGPYAFSGCENLETVIFPEYVDANKDPVAGYYGSITVGHYAFAGCEKLKEFLTPTGEVDSDGNALYERNSDRMTTMYEGAFYGCTGLESIDISELRIAGDGVFAGCTGLQEVITGPSTAFGAYMFNGCKNLREFNFEGNRLPDYAFYNCRNLKTFTFADRDDFLGIGEEALANTAIDKITLPKGSYPVGRRAMAGCSDLTEVSLYAGTELQYMGVNPFVGCDKLTEYKIIGEGDAYKLVDGVLYNASGDTLLALPTGIKDFQLPAEVKHIGPAALSGSSLISVNLTNIESVGAGAFAESKLVDVIWSPNIDTIPDYAFAYCSDLRTISGVENVKKVGAMSFAQCVSLTNVVLPQATEIGDGAFSFAQGNMSIVLSNNALASVQAPELQKIGDRAFMGASITRADYPNATELGAWAFAACDKLTYANFGAVVRVEADGAEAAKAGMGSHLFYRSTALKEVHFAQGTNYIAPYAFSTFYAPYDNIPEYMYPSLSDTDKMFAYILQNYMNIGTSNTLTTVDLPDTVTEIGDYAFTGQAGLVSLELSGVKTVGESAFRLCGALTGLDLGQLVSAGDYAFYGTALTDVSLDSIKEIGAYAFAGGAETLNSLVGVARDRRLSGGNIANLTIGNSIQKIGDYAFAGNQLTEVTLPSIATRFYEYREDLLDRKNRVERWRIRKEKTIGAGIFAYNDTLTSIDVEGTGAYRSIDGVLYVDLGGSYELVQYPGGRPGTDGKYTVANGTSSIATSAFEGANNAGLRAVEFCYSVKEIGGTAFFNSSVKEYTFNSVQAPALLVGVDGYANELYKAIFAVLYHNEVGYYPWDIDPADNEMRLDMDNIFVTGLYGNFNYYVFLSGYNNIFFSFSNDPDEEESDQDLLERLTFNIPKNGRGYDSPLFTSYATYINTTDTDLPDDNAYGVIEAIDELEALYPSDDLGALDASQSALDSELSLKVKAAREAYNKVTGSDQLKLVEAQFDALLKYEAALRDARKAHGIVVGLQSVTLSSQPIKTYYNEGDTFDPTGMQIRVLYTDGSEIILKDNEINIEDSLIKGGSRSQTIVASYYDAYTETTTKFNIIVNVVLNSGGSTEPSNPDDPSGPSGSGEGDLDQQLPVWAIAVIAVGAVLIAAAGTAAALIALKKKGRKSEAKPSDKGAEQKPEEAEQTPEAQEPEFKPAEQGDEAPTEGDEQ